MVSFHPESPGFLTQANGGTVKVESEVGKSSAFPSLPGPNIAEITACEGSTVSETTTARITTASRVYLIMALFVALIFCLVLLIQVQMDALNAIRAYVGGEGLWAKAQKESVHSLEHYAISRDEADYMAYRRLIQVPLGDRIARIELQKEHPDIAVAWAGFFQGRNHPDDFASMIRFFRRFQHSGYMARVIEHWTTGDRMIAELNVVAEALHEEIASGRNDPEAISASSRKSRGRNRVEILVGEMSSDWGEGYAFPV